jgi:hypothetical protein
MATETQYGIFKTIYDEEAERYSNLEARARVYFSIISLYLGALAFKVEDVQRFATAFNVPFWLFLLSGTLLVLSLLATILSLQIRDYERICDPEVVVDAFGDEPPTDEAFLDDRIVDLAVATNRNRLQNYRTAHFLSISAIFLFLGVIVYLAIFAIAVIRR